jgi:hypothetical protein
VEKDYGRRLALVMGKQAGAALRMNDAGLARLDYIQASESLLVRLGGIRVGKHGSGIWK